MLTLDGSVGEGGGQIIRTALALSMLTSTSFRMENIRARRAKPGLLRQHLTGVNAAATISQAEVTGNQLGSTEMSFVPGSIVPGAYTFSIGSAGSTSLVLQTLLPALMLAKEASRIKIDGGTHNSASPPFHFLQRAFLPLLSRMGPQVKLELERWGFYPAGGGRIIAEIQPVERLSPLLLLERGDIESYRIEGIVSGLSESIGRREVVEICKALNRPLGEAKVMAIPEPQGPGNVVMVTVQCEDATEVFTGFGEKSIRAEEVAKRVSEEVLNWQMSDAPVGAHLADQLLIPLALGGGAFRTTKPSEHTLTNIGVIEKFVGVKFRIEPEVNLWWIGV